MTLFFFAESRSNSPSWVKVKENHLTLKTSNLISYWHNDIYILWQYWYNLNLHLIQKKWSDKNSLLKMFWYKMPQLDKNECKTTTFIYLCDILCFEWFSKYQATNILYATRKQEISRNLVWLFLIHFGNRLCPW